MTKYLKIKYIYLVKALDAEKICKITYCLTDTVYCDEEFHDKC